MRSRESRYNPTRYTTIEFQFTISSFNYYDPLVILILCYMSSLWSITLKRSLFYRGYEHIWKHVGLNASIFALWYRREFFSVANERSWARPVDVAKLQREEEFRWSVVYEGSSPCFLELSIHLMVRQQDISSPFFSEIKQTTFISAFVRVPTSLLMKYTVKMVTGINRR